MSLPIVPDSPPCTLCVLGEGAITNCVPARRADGVKMTSHHRPKDVRVLLVGEGPGEVEDEVGLPFTGPSGTEILDPALEVLGVDLRTIVISNAIRCRPPENRSPKIGELRACFTYLCQEIDALKPELVICLGAQAWRVFLDHWTTGTTPKGSVSANRLRAYPWSTPSGVRTLVGVTFHPAAVLRDKSRLRDFLDDLNGLIVEEVWGKERDEEEVKVTVVTKEMFDAWMEGQCFAPGP